MSHPKLPFFCRYPPPISPACKTPAWPSPLLHTQGVACPVEARSAAAEVVAKNKALTLQGDALWANKHHIYLFIQGFPAGKSWRAIYPPIHSLWVYAGEPQSWEAFPPCRPYPDPTIVSLIKETSKHRVWRWISLLSRLAVTGAS